MVAVLAFCATATAQSAPIKLTSATKLARTLAKKQVKNRQIVFFHVFESKRVGRNTIVFSYDDRSAKNVYCTANLLVTRKVTAAKTTLTARFRNQACRPVPADALAVEAATRAATRAQARNDAAVTRSVAALDASVKRCRKLKVPRARRATVLAIYDIAFVQAFERPNDAILGDFVTALRSVDTSTPALVEGINAWSDYLAAIRALPQIPDPCATLTNWSKDGFATAKSPIDMNAYAAINRRSETDQRVITKAARYLDSRGVFPRVVLEFTTEGQVLGGSKTVQPAGL
jgi:hypothetical protein